MSGFTFFLLIVPMSIAVGSVTSILLCVLVDGGRR